MPLWLRANESNTPILLGWMNRALASNATMSEGGDRQG
jgi:hypothetical protein